MKKKKVPPAYLFALGKEGVPQQLAVAGVDYRLRELFKHDFFAATALYDVVAPPAGAMAPAQAVLKIQRVAGFFGVPLAWLGEFVCHHEVTIYAKLQGLGGIPRLLGRVGRNGFLHEYIPGQVLEGGRELPPDFFDRLQDLLRAIHAQDIAYVDTNKCENILVGTDGRPYLIDFQISWHTFRWARRFRWARWMLAQLQASDWYHFYKHKARLAPQRCSPADLAAATRRSWHLRVHRFLAQPLIRVRRRFLARYELSKTK